LSSPAPAVAPHLSERETHLARVPFFEGLTPEGLALVVKATTEEVHAAGETIVRTGETAEKLFIILDGQVRISRDLAGTGEDTLAMLGAGDFFGDMSLVDPAPSSAGAHAHERCRLLVITKEKFDDLLFLHKDLAYEVLWSCVRILTARLREANDRDSSSPTIGRI